ncbi:MAG TPA: glycosyltransferase family 4 protein [Burkholderiales bacterium]|nr:glycosyltransferase family 4 protein [Burkholderiales bacterium]
MATDSLPSNVIALNRNSMRVAEPADIRHAGERAPAFVLLSFEGPDPYSMAGGLGSRISGLACALAEEGYETHLFFIGAPDLPGHEIAYEGRLHLHRWCQWISQYHPGGVYDGEESKLRDWSSSLPAWTAENLLPPLMEMHRPIVVLAEEWHTSWSIVCLQRLVQEKGWGDHVRFFWNANNSFGFERVPWRELDTAATITTVSRFMKHQMWDFGVDPRVIPNGIATDWLQPSDRHAVQQLKRSTDGRLLLTKVARWDPDKRWLMAVDAVGELKHRGARPLLIARGGIEAHGREVVGRARAIGLSATSIRCEDKTAAALWRAIRNAQPSDVLFVESALSRPQLQCLYRASDGVLANSGIEPFGLVGLEAMACGGVSFLGATGEDYATPGHDAISLQSSSPRELVGHLLYLREHPHIAARLRVHARKTATRYTWEQVIRAHITPIVSWPEFAVG